MSTCKLDNRGSTKSQTKCFEGILTAGMVTSLALAVISALALIGFFRPASPLGLLGKNFGLIGASTTLAIHLAFFGALLIARFTCKKPPVGNQILHLEDEDKTAVVIPDKASPRLGVRREGTGADAPTLNRSHVHFT